MTDTPNLDENAWRDIDPERLVAVDSYAHPPRLLLLYGSLREHSFSRLMTEESARVLQRFGAEARIFDAKSLPLPDGANAAHGKVLQLREMVTWSEGMVWCSSERHGAMTNVMKSQID